MTNPGKARALAILGIALASAGVYANSLGGPFIFDDMLSIVESPNVRTLWPLSSSMDAPPGSGASGRPLVALSLALNYALGGLNVFGYHLFNVAVHILTGLALFGFARRALRRTNLRPGATALAFSSALLWVVHPLGSDAINHVITRNVLLVSCLILATLYAAERSMDVARPAGWRLLAILAASAAMMSKEIAVSLPLMVLAYDRTFVAGSFRRAWVERRNLYLGLAATWIVLGLSLASAERGVAVGFGGDLSSTDYLRTQAQGLAHYLRLSFWPSPLAVDYSGWAPVRTWGPALLPGALILTLLLTSLVAFIRGSRAGWVGLAIFAILSPSSSVIPITGEWLAEHRMYLPLAGLVVLMVVGVLRLLTRLQAEKALPATCAIALVASLSMGAATFSRNRDYVTANYIWEDCLRKYPNNARAHDHLASIWSLAGEYELALEHSEAALRLDPSLYTVDVNMAAIQLQLGNPEKAREHFERAEQFVAGDYRFHAGYGIALERTGDRQRAIAELGRAVQLAPEFAPARRNLGLLLIDSGEAPRGVQLLRESLQLEPNLAGLVSLIRALASNSDPAARNGAEALNLTQSLIQSSPPDPRWYDLLGMSHAELGQFKPAIAATSKALEGAQQLRQQELARDLEARLELYSREQAYRE